MVSRLNQIANNAAARCASIVAHLREVLDDLHAHGVGLGPALTREVLDPPAPIGRVTQGAATLTVTPALALFSTGPVRLRSEPSLGQHCRWHGRSKRDGSSACLPLRQFYSWCSDEELCPPFFLRV
jgi:hypothetical protein